MIPRNLSGDVGPPTPWQELEAGASTISAFAELCRRSLISPPESSIDASDLSAEAKTILVAGANRGVIDVRAFKEDFDSVQRFLAICVETQPGDRILFLQRDEPEQTVAFLEGFAELCRNGLIMHHLGRDFSFSKLGFSMASQLVESGAQESVAALLEFGTAVEH
jgi:hypothetical protein